MALSLKKEIDMLGVVIGFGIITVLGGLWVWVIERNRLKPKIENH